MGKKQKKCGLNIVGIGPGDIDNLTLKAFKALKESDIIIGYSTYIELLKDIEELKDKNIISFPMGTEEERSILAIELAKDNLVCLVSSGDSGIYGLSSLVLELLDLNDLDIDFNIIPGITAAIACSSLVGAPLANDFCCINLSDLLTPFEVVIKRVNAAIDGDFVIALYNPSSKKRKKQFQEVVDILKNRLGEEIPIAVVKNAYRENQETKIINLKDLVTEDIDMKTLLIIGNSQTVFNEKNDNMYTKRGYK